MYVEMCDQFGGYRNTSIGKLHDIYKPERCLCKKYDIMTVCQTIRLQNCKHIFRHALSFKQLNFSGI